MRRRLLVCALLGHDLRWLQETPIDRDSLVFHSQCKRCGFCFDSFSFSHTATVVLGPGVYGYRDLIENEKRRIEERANRW